MMAIIRHSLLIGVVLLAGSPAMPSADDVRAGGSNAGERTHVVSAEAYVDVARATLMEALRSREGRFVVHTRGEYRDMTLAGHGRVEINARAPNADTLPGVVVWVDMRVGSRVVRRLPVYFRVSQFVPALVATRRLHARTALDPHMFELREVDVAHVRGGAVASPEQLQGKRLRRDLAAGHVLAIEALQQRPPVERGERIQVSAHVGRVRVETTAIARRDGFEGQRIDAELLDGSTTLDVEVVGENRARVRGDG